MSAEASVRLPGGARKRGGKRRFLLLLALAVGIYVVGTGAIYVLDALIFNPWALSLTGGPTLTGSWTGPLSMPGGATRTLHLVLSSRVSRRCVNCALEGSARLCDGSSLLRAFTIGGDTDNWSGSDFHVSFTPDSDFRQGELRIGELTGHWTGDTLKLAGPYWFHSDTASAEARRGESPAPAPAISVEMRRGGKTGC